MPTTVSADKPRIHTPPRPRRPRPTTPVRRVTGSSEVHRLWRTTIESLNAAAADALALAACIDDLDEREAAQHFAVDPDETAAEARHFAWFIRGCRDSLESTFPSGM